MHDPGGETNFYLKFMEINYSDCELPNVFCLYYYSHHLSWCNLSIFQAFSVMQSVCRCIKQKLKLEKCSRGRKDPHLLCCHNFLLKVNEVKICARLTFISGFQETHLKQSINSSQSLQSPLS